MKHYYETSKPKLMGAVLAALFAQGYSLGAQDVKTMENMEKIYGNWHAWPLLSFDPETRRMDMHYNGYAAANVLLEQVLDGSLAPVVEVVKLNSGHEAIVSKNGVKVNCQTFPLDVIDKLAAAKAKVLASK